MKRNLLDIIIDIILFLLAILVIYWLIELIIGGSPDLSQINSALIIMVAGFLIRIYREVGEIKVGIRHSFNHIKEDMNSLKGDMSLIKKKLKV